MLVDKILKRKKESQAHSCDFLHRWRDVWGHDCSKTSVLCPQIPHGSSPTRTCNSGPSPTREDQAQAPHCPRHCQIEASYMAYTKDNPQSGFLDFSVTGSWDVSIWPQWFPHTRRVIWMLPTAAAIPFPLLMFTPSAHEYIPQMPFFLCQRWHTFPRTADDLVPFHIPILYVPAQLLGTSVRRIWGPLHKVMYL